MNFVLLSDSLIQSSLLLSKCCNYDDIEFIFTDQWWKPYLLWWNSKCNSPQIYLNVVIHTGKNEKHSYNKEKSLHINIDIQL